MHAYMSGASKLASTCMSQFRDSQFRRFSKPKVLKSEGSQVRKSFLKWYV